MAATRRDFLCGGLGAAAGLTLTGTSPAAAASDWHLACNQYAWVVFYRREGRDFNANLDAGLGDLRASGLNGYEPTLNSPAEVARLGPLLARHGLAMRSFYVNSTLHEPERVEAGIGQVVAIARAARALGARLCVTNPSPLRWGGDEDKSDAQLRSQAAALNRLGRALRDAGVTLAYHNHDSELRRGAREFHHMLAGTDPALVSFCLDAHWIYRGCGNSEVAVLDAVRLYGARIREVHLRQSQGGVWSEVLGPGDIDYGRLAALLRARGIRPHWVLEQAVEKGTPHTLNPVTAFRRSATFARETFGHQP